MDSPSQDWNPSLFSQGFHVLIVVCLDSDMDEFMGYVVGDPLEYDFWITPGRAYFIWVADSATLVY